MASGFFALLVLRVADSLEYGHRSGIVHIDLAAFLVAVSALVGAPIIFVAMLRWFGQPNPIRIIVLTYLVTFVLSWIGDGLQIYGHANIAVDIIAAIMISTVIAIVLAWAFAGHTSVGFRPRR